MADFTAPASNAGSVREGILSRQSSHCSRAGSAGRLAVLRARHWNIGRHLCGRRCLRLAARQPRNLEPKAGAAGRRVSCWSPLSPPIEEFNAASLTFIVLALGIGLLLTTNRDRHRLGERAAALRDLYLVGPFRFFRDAIAAFNLPALKTGFAVWFVPIVLGGIFVFLLVSANPLLEKWISLLNPGNTASYVEPRTRTVLDRGAVDRLALHPRPVERQAGDAGRLGRSGGTGAGNTVGPKRLLRCCDDPAFADPVQLAVRRSNRSRRGLSLGQRDPARRYQLRCHMRTEAPIPSLSRRCWRRASFWPR